MTASEQIVAIIGSTGTQGLGVLQSLLPTPHPIRALTRTSSKLDHIKASNLAVVQTDISDSSALKESLKGVWALFVNTMSDWSLPEGSEEALLKSIIDVAAESGVEWLILSDLPEGVPATAFVEKSNAGKYAREVAQKSSLKPISVQVSPHVAIVHAKVESDDSIPNNRWAGIWGTSQPFLGLL